jgi:general secretion pathway protein G
MKKPVSYSKKRRSGFTLVELVVVVLVLGVIASVAAPKMFDTANDARENATIQSLAVIRDAIELHRAQNGAYPGDLGTEADFKNDLKDFLKGQYPTNQISGTTNNANVTVSTAGTALSAGGTTGWKYDKTSGELIINTTGFDTL